MVRHGLACRSFSQYYPVLTSFCGKEAEVDQGVPTRSSKASHHMCEQKQSRRETLIDDMAMKATANVAIATGGSWWSSPDLRPEESSSRRRDGFHRMFRYGNSDSTSPLRESVDNGVLKSYVLRNHADFLYLDWLRRM